MRLAVALLFFITATAHAAVSSIAQLQALPTPAIFDAQHVGGYASVGDGGAGDFEWNGIDMSAKVASDPYHCVYVAPNADISGASGAWSRDLIGINFNVDFCGAGSGAADVLPNIQAGLTLCPTGEVHFSKRDYRMADLVGVFQPAGCNVTGVRAALAYPLNGTFLDFSGNSTTGPLWFCGSLTGQPTNNCNTTNIFINGTSTASKGFYFANISNSEQSYLFVTYNTGGPGYVLGTNQNVSLDTIDVYQSGSSGHGEIEITGDLNAAMYGTTLNAHNVDAEVSSTATCGIMIDAELSFVFVNMISEANNIPLCLGYKSGTRVVAAGTFIGGDLEGATGPTDVDIGHGGNLVIGQTFMGVEAAQGSNATSLYHITNSDSLLVTQPYVQPSGSIHAFDFYGSNTNAIIRPSGAQAFTYITPWVYVNGTLVSAANDHSQWCMNGTCPH